MVPNSLQRRGVDWIYLVDMGVPEANKTSSSAIRPPQPNLSLFKVDNPWHTVVNTVLIFPQNGVWTHYNRPGVVHFKLAWTPTYP